MYNNKSNNKIIIIIYKKLTTTTSTTTATTSTTNSKYLQLNLAQFNNNNLIDKNKRIERSQLIRFY